MATLNLPSQLQAKSRKIEHVVHVYGDLLFDLCEAVLWSPSNAQIAFRAILKKIRQRISRDAYLDHERAWVLQIACAELERLTQKVGRTLSPSEQIMLDANLDTGARLKSFDSYFHRLPPSDQILLLLRDKYGLPFKEISSILQLPEGSLKIKRQQALRTLESWIWGER